MQRVTITMDDDLLAEIDRLVERRGYQNRSEVIRDLTRRGIRQVAEESGSQGPCIAALVYVYDHESRDLPRRLTALFHGHHDLTISSMHVHLDHHACLELNVLRGASSDVRRLAEHVSAERGVLYGRLTMVPIELEEQAHHHGGNRRRHLHTHVPKAG